MAAEVGHAPNRCYVDQAGNFHLNGAQFFNDAEADIATSLEVLNALAPAELNYLDTVVAGTALADKAMVLDSSKGITGVTSMDLVTLTNADLVLESLNPLTMKLNDTDALQYDNGPISGFAGETDAAGNGVYIETEDGGTDGGTASTGQAGGALSMKCGDGSAAVTADAVGGAGGAMTVQGGAGAAGDGSGDGGAGGDVNITSGVGGADGGTGTDGASGDIVLTVGAITGDGPQGHVKLGSSASWIAAGTGNPAFGTAKGYSGASDIANVAKWLILKDNSGGVFYVPAWQ